MSIDTRSPLYRSAKECGFNPSDPAVWAWWTGLPDADREDLICMSGRGKMRTFTDVAARETNTTSTRGARWGAVVADKRSPRRSARIAALIRETDAR